MKRDMDLVRRIMVELSESEGPLPASAFADGSHDLACVGYHFRIMGEAGLIRARILEADDDPFWVCEALDLTWEGQEFLANVRRDSVWSKVKLAVAKRAGDASFKVLAKVAEAEVEKLFLG